MMRTLPVQALVGALALVLLAACSGSKSEQTQQPVFHAEDNPRLLSAWGMMDSVAGDLKLSDGVIAYDLNAPLFTDYAHKLRTIWMPTEAGPAAYRAGTYLDMPVGTVISKTFYYPKGPGANQVLKQADPDGVLNPILQRLDQVRLMETRLLVHRQAGWEAVSYVWNEEQTDAQLTRIGDAQALTLVEATGAETDFTYIVPDVNQCSGCHAPNNTSREIEPLGVRTRHINKGFVHNDEVVNQLSHLQSIGYLTGWTDSADEPRNASWTDGTVSLDQRARSYLDINCSHCHNPVGPADTSGLDLTVDVETGPALGLCKLPIAAGAGTGGRAFGIDPGAPDQSIFLYRMETTDPGAMMPELGRSLAHAEGAALIRDWIADMDGTCAS